MSQVNSVTTSPSAVPRQSPANSPSGIRGSSPVSGGREGGASSPVLSPADATAVDAILRGRVDIAVEGSGQGAEYTPEQLEKYHPKNPRVSALKNSEKDSKKNSNRDSTGSVDSNSCLSPDMWDMKERLSRQPNPFRPNHTLFNAPATPEVLKTASKVLRAREAGHAAEKQGLRSDLAGLQVEIAQLTSEKTELLQQSSALNSQIVDDKLLLAMQRLELESGSKELSKMEKKYTVTKAVLMAQTAALAYEVESKQKEKEALESTLLALNADKSFLETTHSSKIEALDGQYSKRHADLTKSVADLESELGSARLQIEKQAESVTEMSEKLRKSLEINKGLEANNKALVKANKGLVVKESKTASEADRLRSELEDQKRLVAKLLLVIENPSQDISEDSIAKGELDVPVSTKAVVGVTFAKTPENVSPQKSAFAFVESEKTRVNDDSPAALLGEGAEPPRSVDGSASLPAKEAVRPDSRRESLDSVQPMTIEQKREQQAAEEKRLRDEKKAQRAAKLQQKNSL